MSHTSSGTCSAGVYIYSRHNAFRLHSFSNTRVFIRSSRAGDVSLPAARDVKFGRDCRWFNGLKKANKHANALPERALILFSALNIAAGLIGLVIRHS